MKKAFALSGVVATAFLVIAAVNQVPQGGGGSATNAQPPSANLTNWSNVATGAFIRSSSGRGTNTSLEGNINIGTNNTIASTATPSTVEGWNNWVTNVNMIVKGSFNRTYGSLEHEEGGGFIFSHRSTAGFHFTLTEDGFGIFGGSYNTNYGNGGSTIVGGTQNRVGELGAADLGTLGGSAVGIFTGTLNAISNEVYYATIGGGSNNVIRGVDGGAGVTYGGNINGGQLNVISNSPNAFIIGGQRNHIIGANAAGVVGNNLTNLTANTLDLGVSNATKITINHSNTTVRTTLTITSGSPGDGKVLTSDANGLGSWQTPAASSSGTNADNMTITNRTEILTGPLVYGNNADRTTILGRARIDSRTTDNAFFSHFDMTGAGDYALRQDAVGVTHVNAANNQVISFNINGSSKWQLFEGHLLPSANLASDIGDPIIPALVRTGYFGGLRVVQTLDVRGPLRFYPQTNSLAGLGSTNLVVDGGNVAAQSAVVRCTVDANFRILATNLIDGQEITVEVKQDGTGIRTGVIESSNFKFGTDITGLTFSTNAGYIDVFKLRVRGTNAHVVAFVRGYTE